MMDSSLMNRLRFRRRNRFEASKDEDDDDSSVASSRPGTRDGFLTSTSRLSADSGAGSLEDFHHRGSSPLPTTFLDYWDGVRRHTAPARKTAGPKSPDHERPNTVHAWEAYPSRSTMSRYTPLPAIGLRPNESRKYCFQEDLSLEVDPSSYEQFCGTHDNIEKNSDQTREHLEVAEDLVFKRPSQLHLSSTDETYMDVRRSSKDMDVVEDDNSRTMDYMKDEEDTSPSSKILSLDVDSDADSDFDDSCESCVVYTSEEDDSSSKPRKPIVRSATFTIEDKKVVEDNLVAENGIQHPKLLLAVRLPNGSRVSGYFDSRDTLRNVCELAMQNTKDRESLDKFELVTTEVPKRVFSDFAISLSAAGVQDKTLLNLQVCEDSSDSG